MESNHSSKCKFESLYVLWNFFVFLPRFWKNLAVRGRNIIGCQRSPTIAANVSLNLYFHHDISTFPAKFLESLGSTWQKFQWLSNESNQSSKCRFESLYVLWNFFVFLPRFWKNLAVRGKVIKDCQRNPSIAVNVCLNLHIHLNISIFIANILKRLGSAWQKY